MKLMGLNLEGERKEVPRLEKDGITGTRRKEKKPKKAART
jgi:hypothetical protein